MRHNRQAHGFTIIEAVFIVVIVAIIGGVGYMAYHNLIAPRSATQAATSATPAVQSVTVSSSSDLDKVSAQLDSLPVDDSDSTQLDSAANSF